MEERCCICTSRVRKRKCFKCECGYRIHEKCLSQTVRLDCPLCRREMVNLKEKIKEQIRINRKEMNNGIPYRFIRECFPYFISILIIRVLETLNEPDDNELRDETPFVPLFD